MGWCNNAQIKIDLTPCVRLVYNTRFVLVHHTFHPMLFPFRFTSIHALRRSFATLLLTFLFSTRFAFAEQNVISIPCPPAPIEIPEGGLRASSDGDAWNFSIAPQADVVVWNQQWLFNGLSPNAPQQLPA